MPLTQTVFVFGYPFGADLGKEVTVTRSAVTGTHKTPVGYTQTQLSGGLHPGNSGGPVIDPKGSVVGVAVSGVKGTQIQFAVPYGYVHGFLSGRTHRWNFGTPYKDGAAVRQPITTMTYDPLASVRKIRVEVWTGDPGPERVGAKARDPQPGDSERVKADLAYKDGNGAGEFPLPELPAGKVYWVRLVTVKDKSEIGLPARPFRPQPPVERTPIELAYKPAAWDPGPLNLTCDAELLVRDKEGADHNLGIKYQTDLIRESDGKARPDGSSTARLRFSNAKMTVNLDGQPEPKSARVQQLLAQADKVPTTLTVGKDGDLTDIRPNLAAVAPKDRNVMAYLVLQMAQGLDATVIPLAGGKVTPEKSWSAKRDVLLSVAGDPELAVADLTYKYLGVRTVNGRAEAVVLGEGPVRGRKGEGLNVAGKMEVRSTIDVESGQVVASAARIDVDLDLTGDSNAGQVSGVYSVSLRRLGKAVAVPKAGGPAGAAAGADDSDARRALVAKLTAGPWEHAGRWVYTFQANGTYALADSKRHGKYEVSKDLTEITLRWDGERRVEVIQVGPAGDDWMMGGRPFVPKR